MIEAVTLFVEIGGEVSRVYGDVRAALISDWKVSLAETVKADF